MKRFSHNVGSKEYAGDCGCGSTLLTYPDYDKPFRQSGGRTFYLDAVQHEQGVVVRCLGCRRFSIQSLEEWGVEYG